MISSNCCSHKLHSIVISYYVVNKIKHLLRCTFCYCEKKFIRKCHRTSYPRIEWFTKPIEFDRKSPFIRITLINFNSKAIIWFFARTIDAISSRIFQLSLPIVNWTKRKSDVLHNFNKTLRFLSIIQIKSVRKSKILLIRHSHSQSAARWRIK